MERPEKIASLLGKPDFLEGGSEQWTVNISRSDYGFRNTSYLHRWFSPVNVRIALVEDSVDSGTIGYRRVGSDR